MLSATRRWLYNAIADWRRAACRPFRVGPWCDNAPPTSGCHRAPDPATPHASPASPRAARCNDAAGGAAAACTRPIGNEVGRLLRRTLTPTLLKAPLPCTALHSPCCSPWGNGQNWPKPPPCGLSFCSRMLLQIPPRSSPWYPPSRDLRQCSWATLMTTHDTCQVWPVNQDSPAQRRLLALGRRAVVLAHKLC